MPVVKGIPCLRAGFISRVESRESRVESRGRGILRFRSWETGGGGREAGGGGAQTTETCAGWEERKDGSGVAGDAPANAEDGVSVNEEEGSGSGRG